jgi:hypothetical protein
MPRVEDEQPGGKEKKRIGIRQVGVEAAGKEGKERMRRNDG